MSTKQEFYSIAQEVITTTDIERKQNAEVLTPISLAQEMIDKIPSSFWKEKKKLFEPACGKGVFLALAYDKFKKAGLSHKTILTECLYFADINPFNIHVTKMILDPANKYKLNAYCGDTLKMEFDFKFDIIVGNPPYNDNSGNKGKGHTLWTKFIEISLKKWINEGGYLLYVTPSLWRQADHPLQTIMKQYQIEYLEIHDEADGVKIFNCNTRYDWYLINKVPYYKNSEIKTQVGEIVLKDLSKMNFIPNYNYDFIDKLVNGVEKINLIESRSAYGHDKKWVQKIKTDEYKYPVVYSVNRKNQATFHYSNKNDNGHFGYSKVIFGSGATGFIIDENGEYGLTQWATGIEDKIENLNQIKNALDSSKFKNEVIKATSVSKAEINRKILKYFKKDFWKEFI